jgi:hypothetical protein
VAVVAAALLTVSSRVARVQTQAPTAATKTATVQAAGKGNPLIHLEDGYELSASFSHDARANAAIEQSLGTPLSLAAADFDEDGVPDLVAGYGSGKIALYRGNIDAIYPNSRTAQQRKASGQYTEEAFLPGAQIFDVPVSPDVIEAGDFNADGHKDILVCARDGNSIYLLSGTGRGTFQAAQQIPVNGQVTAMVTGEIGRADGQTDVAVAVITAKGPQLLVFEHPEGAFTHPPEVFPLPAPATDIVLGDLDGDHYSDIAVASGDTLTIIHERGQAYPWDLIKAADIQRPPAIVETRALPFRIAGLAIGEFGNQPDNSLALLSEDGGLFVLEPVKVATAKRVVSAAAKAQTTTPRFMPEGAVASGLSVVPQRSMEAQMANSKGAMMVDSSLSHEEIKKLNEKNAKDEAAKFSKMSKEERALFQTDSATKTTEQRQRTKAAFLRSISAQPSTLAQWHLQTLVTNSGLRASGSSTAKKLIATRISISGKDDLVVVDSVANQLNIVAQLVPPASAGGSFSPQTPKAEITSLEVEGSPVAVLPMRLNSDGLNDLVVLRNGAAQPSIVMTTSSATYTVNDASDNNSSCPSANCTLRGAIGAANLNPGSTIAFDIPGAGVHTISPGSQLPIVVNAVTIDGTTQPGYSGSPLIEIKGNNFQAGQAIDGLKIRASNCVVRGLAINEFPSYQDPNTLSTIGGNGITSESTQQSPGVGHNTFEGNDLGTDPTGTLDKGNQATGLNVFDSSNNTIGGTTAAARNVMSGNGTPDIPGVGLALTGANNNIIQGNYIGVDASGTQALGNSGGMFLTGASNQIGGDAAGAGNVISGNGEGNRTIGPNYHCQGGGIEEDILFGADNVTNLTLNNVVKGNRVGTNAAGTSEVGNCTTGIITNTLTQMTVGSITANGRNVISGNRFGGIFISGFGNIGINPNSGVDYLGGYTIVSGNNISTDITGTVAVANTYGNGCSGFCFLYGDVSVYPGDEAFVTIGSPGGTTPGGACTGLCNLMSGDHDTQQIGLQGAIYRAFGGTVGIFNDYIGTDRTGTVALPNWLGVEHELGDLAGPTYIGAAVPANPGDPINLSLGNLISGNWYQGVSLLYGADSSCVANLIGTDVTGNTALPNGRGGDAGIYLSSQEFSTFYLGGTDPLERNIISGNNGQGVVVSGYGQLVIKNNYIGTNKGGTAPLPNTGVAGLDVYAYPDLITTIGGTEAGAANLIENNGGDGITIVGDGQSPDSFCQIIGNTITNNGGAGVHIGPLFSQGSGASDNNQIGGANAGEGNIIAHNHGTGVLVTGGVGNDIQRNSIHENGGLGIDLSLTDPPDGVTPNHCGDLPGPNDLQNHPVLAAPVFNADGTITVNGALSSDPVTDYRIDFYSNTKADPSNYGQGEKYIGSINVTTGSGGVVTFTFTSTAAVPNSYAITSTATNPNGSTSEFSCAAGVCTGAQSTKEGLEAIAATCSVAIVVNSKGDAPDLGTNICSTGNTIANGDPECTLRAAIQQSNLRGANGQGSQSIVFAIPGSGVQTIAPASALPAITRPVRIYGATQGGAPNTHLIEISGASAGGGADGLQLLAGSDGSVINELTINQFTGGHNGIFIDGSSNNRIEGCYVGLNNDGLSYSGNDVSTNQGTGIDIYAFTTGNTIGGPLASDGNIISGNNIGLSLGGNTGDGDNKVQNNKIGTDKNGNPITINGNSKGGNGTGIYVFQQTGDLIGGDLGSTGNVISGSLTDGVTIENCKGNFIKGNLIGTDGSGLNPIGNGRNGITVTGGLASKNIIGGLKTSERNIISGNLADSSAGVLIDVSASTGNEVLGNYIGVDMNAQSLLPNGAGVIVYASGNTIGSTAAPNIISGNTNVGVGILASSMGGTISGTTIAGNYIGINATGKKIRNGGIGIALVNDVQTTSIRDNTISGNDGVGLSIGLLPGSSLGPSNNTIFRNKIGTDPTGTTAVPNVVGVSIVQASTNNITGNLISGNSSFGVTLGGASDNSVLTTGNNVQNNLIGTSADGTSALPNAGGGLAVLDNAQNNIIGGSTKTNQGNVISGNTTPDTTDATVGFGVFIASIRANSPPSAYPTGNMVQGNRIGLQKTADVALPNNRGVVLNFAVSNVIGGTDPTLANVISGNSQEGVRIDNANSNQVQGNFIGTGSNGAGSVGNGGNGVFITKGSSQNMIGGLAAGAGNTIQFNGGSGVSLDPTAGTGNTIDPNVISGNAMLGIDLGGTGTPRPNVPGGGGGGPNNGQNFPEFSSAVINTSGNLILQYKVDSAPANSNYGTSGIYVEFFKGDASLQGQTFIGSTNYTLANYNSGTPGLAAFNAGNAASLVVHVGDKIVATATDADGNTSEFTSTKVGTVTTPTAAPARVSGQVNTGDGQPLGGVTIKLSGSQNATTITDSAGRYSFENIETDNFYIVTPQRANYSFSPANRSFSLIADKTDAIFTAVADPAQTANPLDTPEFFVRQQYVDFLSREPDATGFNYWTSQINQCGTDTSCLNSQRVGVSNAFFYEQEFQDSGAYVYRVYKSAFGQPPAFAQFQPDRALVVGGASLDQSKTAFALAFVQRDVFIQAYPHTQTANQFVTALMNTISQNSSVDLTSQRASLIALYDGTDNGRAAIVRQLADNPAFVDAEYNRSFVLTQYFGYLQRDPDAGGFNFWLGQVNSAPLRDVTEQHAMVCSFITAAEYQQRFSSAVTHTNAECSH